MDGRVWADVVPHLSGPTIVADLSSDGTVAGMAARARASAEEPLHLVGFSLGAIVALEIWRQDPGSVRTLTVIGLNPAADAPDRAETRRAQSIRARGDLTALMREDFLPRYFAAAPPTPHDAGILEMAAALGPDAFARQTEAQIARPDSTGDLLSVAVPCLVACGAEDRMTPRALHEETARRIPGARFEAIAGAGHLVPLEAPAALAAAIRRLHDDAGGRS